MANKFHIVQTMPKFPKFFGVTVQTNVENIKQM